MNSIQELSEVIAKCRQGRPAKIKLNVSGASFTFTEIAFGHQKLFEIKK